MHFADLLSLHLHLVTILMFFILIRIYYAWSKLMYVEGCVSISHRQVSLIQEHII